MASPIVREHVNIIRVFASVPYKTNTLVAPPLRGGNAHIDVIDAGLTQRGSTGSPRTGDDVGVSSTVRPEPVEGRTFLRKS